MKHLQVFENYINEADSDPLMISKYIDVSKGLTDADLMGETGLLSKVLSGLKDATKFTQFLPFMSGSNQAPDFYKGILKRFMDPGTGVEGVANALSGWVTESNLLYVLSVLKALSGQKMKDGTPAIKRFADLYRQKTGGRGLAQDVNSVGTRTFDVPRYGEDIKEEIIALVQKEGK
jgi:hypothetical protein